MSKSQALENDQKRVLAREFAHEMTREEIELVNGGIGGRTCILCGSGAERDVDQADI